MDHRSHRQFSPPVPPPPPKLWGLFCAWILKLAAMLTAGKATTLIHYDSGWHYL